MDTKSKTNRIPKPRAKRKEPPQPRQPMSSDEMRQKRYMERERKRRRKRLIGYVAAIAALIVLAVVLSLTVFFKIDSFEVRGDEVYSQEQIISATELSVGDNLFAFGKKDVALKVQTKLPYVGELTVKRSLTGKITLTVVADKAVMAVDNGESYTLLDAKCKVLEAEAQNINEGIAVVKASKIVSAQPGQTAAFENPKDTENLTELCALFEKYSITKITEINITDYSNAKLKYDMRLTLKVGILSSFDKKAEFIQATLKKLDQDDPNYSGTIDFTVEDKAYINDIDEEKTTLPVEPETEFPPEETTVETPESASAENNSQN